LAGACDRVLDGEEFLLDRHLLVLGVQLDPCFVIHSVFHNAEKALVSTLADNDRLANQFVAANVSRRRHRPRATISTGIQGRVQAAEICCLSSPALSCHSQDICAAHDEYALVFDQLAVLHEKDTPVDVEDLALASLATVLLDVIIVSDFGPVAVGRHGVSIPTCNLGDLRV
jgi:hypothetical protein